MEVSLPRSGFTVQLSDEGQGQAFLVLHGGAGPGSVAGLAARLAGRGRVIAPVMPGFGGTSRPEALGTIAGLASAYGELCLACGIASVTVIGSSVGGWVAAEMALQDPALVARMVLIDSVGIDPAPEGRGIVDPTAVPPAERAKLVFHDPARFAPPPSPEAMAMMAANASALSVYAGNPFMHDPTLRLRLAGVQAPTLVIWGESDGIVDLAYGRRLAAALPGARFATVAEAGHLPHVERPEEVMDLIGAFLPG